MKKRKDGLVYSTDSGRICADCQKPVDGCICRSAKTAYSGDRIVRVSKDKKGRKGKCVTIVSGVPLDQDDLKTLAKQLKQKSGTGGTVKNGVIEIQGDQLDLLASELTKQGYKVKRSGG